MGQCAGLTDHTQEPPESTDNQNYTSDVTECVVLSPAGAELVKTISVKQLPVPDRAVSVILHHLMSMMTDAYNE